MKTISLFLIPLISATTCFAQDSHPIKWTTLAYGEKSLDKIKGLITLLQSQPAPSASDPSSVMINREALIELAMLSYAQGKVIKELQDSYPAERENIEKHLKEVTIETNALLTNKVKKNTAEQGAAANP